MLVETAIFTHSLLFQYWLLISNLPPMPAFPDGLGSKSVLQTVCQENSFTQTSGKQNTLYAGPRWAKLSLPLKESDYTFPIHWFQRFFLAVLSPTLKLFNYSMQTLGICSSSSYCQCHFLFSLCSIQVFFIIIILFWHSRFCMFCITLLPMLCVCLDSSNPLDKCFMIRLFYLSHCWALCCFRCNI